MVEILPIQPDQIADAKCVICAVAQHIFAPEKTIEEFIKMQVGEHELNDVDNYREIYTENRGQFLVVLDDGKVVGTGAVRKHTHCPQRGCYWGVTLEDDVAELKRIWLLESYHGQKIGFKMVSMLLGFARQHSFRRFPAFFVALFLGLLSLQLACGLSTSAGAPQPGQALATRIAPAPTESISVQVPAVPETRLLTLEFPPTIRAGDSDVVRLTLEVDAQGNLTPTASVAGNVIQGQVLNIPNLYDTHNVLAEARLDMAGMEVHPPDMASEPLQPGQTALFFWSIRPTDPGKYRGTVWLFLHFVPRNGGQESRQPLSAQVIEIEATSLFGIAAGPARWLGVAGTFLSSVLGLPFLEQALKWLWKRIRG